jgi:hypothetical protein
VSSISENHVAKVVSGEYVWTDDKRRKYPPIVKKCRCGTVFMPCQYDARREPDREFFCCNDCLYDSRMKPRPYTHCDYCGKDLPSHRRPESRYCCGSCASKGSHAKRDKSTYRTWAKREGYVPKPVDTVEVPDWLGRSLI